MPVNQRLRNFRLEDALWERLKEAAKRSNQTVSGYVREVLAEALDDAAMRESLVKASPLKRATLPDPKKTPRPRAGRIVPAASSDQLQAAAKRGADAMLKNVRKGGVRVTERDHRGDVASVELEEGMAATFDPPVPERCRLHPKAVIRADGSCPTCALLGMRTSPR